MLERRHFPRTPFESEVRVTHPTFGTVILMMRDFSNGGLFICTKDQDVQMPPLDSTLEVQALAFGESAPILKAKIVRVMPDGVGVMFYDLPEPPEEDETEDIGEKQEKETNS